MEFQSSDFQTALPYRAAVAPSATGTTGAASQLTNPDGQSNFHVPGGIPMSQNCTINTFYTNRDNATAGSAFIGSVRYTR